MRRPELLAPAGNMEKLQTAFHFGADAVYGGLSGFSLRSRAGNFNIGQLKDAVATAHAAGGRFYLALNLMPYDADLDMLTGHLKEIEAAGPDALIVSDPGVLLLLQTEGLSIPVHLSTQANVMNGASASFWFRQGVHRIVLARELSLDQIARVCRETAGQLEVFVHGAVCIAYSGRCFLSHYMTGRSANRGDCAQSCRWAYRELEEERRPGERYGLASDERGSYLFNATDLCALPVLPELVATGAHAFKIEGRMRSRHYLAVTVDVYRHALDVLTSSGETAFRRKLPQWVRELERVGNRRFSTHFLTGSPSETAYRFSEVQVQSWNAYVGVVTQTADHRVGVKLANPVTSGETLELVQPGMRRVPIQAEPMVDAGGRTVTAGKAGHEVFLPLPADVTAREGDVVRR